MIEVYHMCGNMLNPGAYNYTHHPFPILWIYTALEASLGDWGIEFLSNLARLVGLLLTFSTLRKLTDDRAAWVASLLCAVAPASIFFSMDPSVIALGSVTWPVCAWIFFQMKDDRAKARALGFVVFAGGQVSWLTLTLLPSLMILTKSPNTNWKDDFLHPLRNRYWRAMIIGGGLTLLLFIIQILVYSPHLAADWDYLLRQSSTSSTHTRSRWEIFPSILLRIVALTGPALLYGAFRTFFKTQKSGAHRLSIERAGQVFFAIFILTGLVLSRFFLNERSMYEYLVFPAACLTAIALHRAPHRRTVAILVLLAAASLAYAQIQSTVPRLSSASIAIGNFVKNSSTPRDWIFTDLQEQRPPFETWDVGSFFYTSQIADRLMVFYMETPVQLEKNLASLTPHPPSVFFLLNRRAPNADEWNEYLVHHGELVSHLFEKQPATREALSLRLRNCYWKLLGLHQVDSRNSAADGTVDLDLYRIHPTWKENSTSPF